MKVLGIDPGSETLGWGVVEGEGLKYRLVDFGTVKSSPKESFSKRVLKIGDGVGAVIEKFQPDVISVEEAFYATNVKVALKLGQVRGVVLYLGEKAGLEIAEYSPRLVKQTVVGYGNAEKHQVQEMVQGSFENENRAAAARCGGRARQRHLSFSSRRSAE